MTEFSGKVAFATSASTLLGQGIVRAFVAAIAKLVMAAVRRWARRQWSMSLPR